jgi:hypothetical protein
MLKAHRGLSESVARGLSAGGRLYGYRTVPVTCEVCAHGRGYQRQRLEAAVLGAFRAAMTPPMISTLTDLVNKHVEIAFRERSRGIEHVKAEIPPARTRGSNLVRFLAEGGESATVRSELQEIERALQGLRLELAGREVMPSVPPRVHPTGMGAKLERLDQLLA